MSNERRDHVCRATVPWRSAQLTECGRGVDQVGSAITSTELDKRLRKDGKQRTAITVCMTCYERSAWNARATWENYPIGVLARDVRRAGEFPPGASQPWREEQTQLTRELRAIAALIEAHREEFDGYLAGLDEVTELGAKRRSKQQRRA